MEVRVLACPHCAAKISSNAKVCEYCGYEYMISSFSSLLKIGRQDINKYVAAYSDALKTNPNDPSLNRSAGICFMSLGIYDKALACFERQIDSNPEGSFAYYVSAMCLLNGKSAFITEKKKIDKAIEYLKAAIVIEEKGIYHYLMAYFKYDYYKRKFLKIEPDYNYHLSAAHSFGVSTEDILDLFNLLKVEVPKGFLETA
ncbi:MAG: zinc-ribbon domain-containing protein [Methanomassiliicoccaceae archaeon]|nr:zinc-ribbon domain-containing protein [Methanomassiliicoccaceae archaeon]